MTKAQELQAQEKQEVTKAEETTIPARFFVPQTDIFEDEESLTIILEMPGVNKENVTADLENDVLRIEGKIDFSKYEDLEPVYTEYNIGHYKRAFTLSNKIDQSKISADMENGVLKLILPKSEEVKPRKITVN